MGRVELWKEASEELKVAAIRDVGKLCYELRNQRRSWVDVGEAVGLTDHVARKWAYRYAELEALPAPWVSISPSTMALPAVYEDYMLGMDLTALRTKYPGIWTRNNHMAYALKTWALREGKTYPRSVRMQDPATAKSAYFHLRMTVGEIAALKQLAAKKGFRAATLVRMWLRDAAAQEGLSVGEVSEVEDDADGAESAAQSD